MEGGCLSDAAVDLEEFPRRSLSDITERASRAPLNPLKKALSIIVLGSVLTPSLASSPTYDAIDINDWGRSLQDINALAGNSYAIFGQRIDSSFVQDPKNMAKYCFNGLGLKGCKVRQSFRDEAGDGWLMEETAELNALLDWDDDDFLATKTNDYYW
jgi:hypothetical protein